MCPDKAYAVLHRGLFPEREAGGKNVIDNKTYEIACCICHVNVYAQL